MLPYSESVAWLNFLYGVCGMVAEGFRQRALALKFGTSSKSHYVDDMGSSPVHPGKKVTGYPTATVDVGKFSYQLSCGRVVEGFRRQTLASKFGTSHPSRTKRRWVYWAQQPWLAASLGRRRATPTRSPRVPGVLDSLDV